MNSLWILPLLLQGFFILIDEFYFHRKRGLPPWEVWGHPLDSISVAFPFWIASFSDFESQQEFLFIAAAIFSTLFVTKDEFVHAKLCKPTEHLLHALLFVLHPTAFFCAYQFWEMGQAHFILRTHFFLISLFTIYQIAYWSPPWKLLRVKLHK